MTPPIIPSQLKCHHSQPHEFSMDPITISLGGAFSGWWVVTRLSVSIGYCVVTALPPRPLSMGEEEAVCLPPALGSVSRTVSGAEAKLKLKQSL